MRSHSKQSLVRGARRLVALACCAIGFAAASGPSHALGVIDLNPPFGADTQSYTWGRCWIEQVQYTDHWYNANGHCYETTRRKNGPNAVNVPWSAVGRYDPATHEATESIRIVKGGLDIPSHEFYGTLDAKLVCSEDPWLAPVQDCGVASVTTTETIPRDFVDGLIRNRRRPFTSDLTPDQRAAVQREYRAAIDRLHQMVTVHPGTGVDVPATTSTISAPGRSGPGGAGNASNPSAIPVGRPVLILAHSAATPSATAATVSSSVAAASTAVALPAADIVEPAAGSQLRLADVRLRIRDAGFSAGSPQGMATVEITSMPPRPASPGASSGTASVRTLQVPIADLLRGVALQGQIVAVGATVLRVRTSANGPWSSGVSFTIVGEAAPQARTPAVLNWGAQQSAGSQAMSSGSSLRPAATPGVSSLSAGAPASALIRK